jgi:hypothetical protein
MGGLDWGRDRVRSLRARAVREERDFGPLGIDGLPGLQARYVRDMTRRRGRPWQRLLKCGSCGHSGFARRPPKTPRYSLRCSKCGNLAQ